MKKAIATRLLCRSGLRILLGRAIEWSGLLVLNYHRVGDGKESPFDRGLWSADAQAFTDQIRFCKSQLDLITPDDIPRVMTNGSGRYALITSTTDIEIITKRRSRSSRRRASLPHSSSPPGL